MFLKAIRKQILDGILSRESCNLQNVFSMEECIHQFNFSIGRLNEVVEFRM